MLGSLTCTMSRTIPAATVPNPASRKGNTTCKPMEKEVSFRGAGGSGLWSVLVLSLSLLWLAFSRRASSSRWPLALARQSIATTISDLSSSSPVSLVLSVRDVTSVSSNSTPVPGLTSSVPLVSITGWTEQLELRKAGVSGPPSFFISMAPEDMSMSGSLSCSFDQSTMRKPLEDSWLDRKRSERLAQQFWGSQNRILIWFWTWSVQLIYPIKEAYTEWRSLLKTRRKLLCSKKPAARHMQPASAEPVFLSVLWEQDQYVLHSLQGAQGRPAKKEEHILVQNRWQINDLRDSPQKSPSSHL